MQVDNVVSGLALTVFQVSTLTGLTTITASTTSEQTFTAQPVAVGDRGIWFGSNATAMTAGVVAAGFWRCTTAGSLIISFSNTTAGTPTPTAPSATAPWTFIRLSGPGLI